MLLLLGGVTATAIVVIGIWGWTPDRSRHDLESRYWSPETRYIEVDGTRLRIRDTGRQTAPTIIMLHGFGSSLETWEAWARALSADYRVVRFDFPGFGLSEADRSGKYDDVRSLELIKDLMSSLGIESAVVIGNSMGGRIAWQFAAAYPGRVRKLVLISPDGFASPGIEYGKAPNVPWVIHLMKYFLPRAVLRANLASSYGDPTRLDDSVVNRYHDLLLAPGNREAIIDRMHQGRIEDPLPVLRRLVTPTLLLWGEKDRLIPHANAADYVRALPNVSLKSFEDLGHVPQEEGPAESRVPLEQFLAAP